MKWHKPFPEDVYRISGDGFLAENTFAKPAWKLHPQAYFAHFTRVRDKKSWEKVGNLADVLYIYS